MKLRVLVAAPSIEQRRSFRRHHRQKVILRQPSRLAMLCRFRSNAEMAIHVDGRILDCFVLRGDRCRECEGEDEKRRAQSDEEVPPHHWTRGRRICRAREAAKVAKESIVNINLRVFA
jgi:hypothetical protein